MTTNKNQKYIQEAFLSIPDFKCWLAKVKEDGTQYRYIICHKIYDLSAAKESVLSKHAEGDKHKDKLEKRNNLFKEGSNKKKNLNNDYATIKKPCDHQTPEQYFTGSDKTKTEPMWTVNSIISGFSFRFNGSLSKVFSVMFPYSSTASAFSLRRAKAQNVARHGLALYFKQLLFNDIKKSDILTASFDEKLDQAIQTSERNTFVRY